MGNSRINDVLERLLSFDLFVEDPKSYVFYIDDIGILLIKLNFLLDNAEDKLHVIQIFILSKINIPLLCFSATHVGGKMRI